MAIISDAKIGRSTDTKRGMSGAPARTRGPSHRPNATKTSTGTTNVPINPSGSRTKILISSHVSFQSPRGMVLVASVPDRVAGQLEKDVFERRNLGAEVDDAHPMLGQTVDHVR